jgi:hypothetical protein
VNDPELDVEELVVSHIHNEELSRACPVGGRDHRGRASEPPGWGRCHRLVPRGFDHSTLTDNEGNSSLCCVVTAPAQPFLFMSVNGVVEGGAVCCGGLADGWRSTPCRSSMGTVYDECEDETVEANLRR